MYRFVYDGAKDGFTLGQDVAIPAVSAGVEPSRVRGTQVQAIPQVSVNPAFISLISTLVDMTSAVIATFVFKTMATTPNHPLVPGVLCGTAAISDYNCEIDQSPIWIFVVIDAKNILTIAVNLDADAATTALALHELLWVWKVLVVWYG